MNYLFKNIFIDFFVVIVKSETTTVFRTLTYLFVKPDSYLSFLAM